MLIDGARSSSFFQREDLVRASTITSAINHKNPKKSQTPKITRGAPNTCLPRFCLESCGLQKWMLANGCDWIRAASGSIWVFEFLNIISPPYCMNTMNACKWLWLVEEGIGFRSTIPRLNSQGADLPAGPAAKYYLCKRLPSHSLAQSMLTLGSPGLPAGWILFVTMPKMAS